MIEYKKNFHTDSNLEDANSVPIRWIDINQLKANDNDDKFTKWWFILYGNRNLAKRWWLLFIPLINFVYMFILFVFYIIPSPFRLLKINNQLNHLYKNSCDIEDSKNISRIIRNSNHLYGICKWGRSYEYSRKVLLESKYKSIRRYNDDIFIIEDSNTKFGIFNASTSIWIAPCDNDSIYISKEGYLVVTKQSQKTLYNRSGYRIIK